MDRITPQYNINTTIRSGNEVPHVPGLLEFNTDPISTLGTWKDMIAEDRHANRSIKEYRVMKILESIGKSDRGMIATFLKQGYSIYSQLPNGLISLATEKDEIEKYITDDFSARHLLVMLLSYNEKPKPTPSTIYQSADITNNKYHERTETSDSSSDFKAVEYNFEDIRNPVKFTLSGENLSRSTELDEKIDELYSFIGLLNAVSTKDPIKYVKITIMPPGETIRDEGLCYPDYQTIQINTFSIYDPDLMSTIAHEMGHAMFHANIQKDLFGNSSDPEWQNIYYLSLGSKNYEIVDDSNYTPSSDTLGHPYDMATELFASSVATYICYPDKLIDSINNANTPDPMKRVGRLIFCYLRDKVFNGLFVDGKLLAKGSLEYEANNPKWSTESGITPDEILDSLNNALSDSKGAVRKAVSSAIHSLSNS
jgi:hypothetical protein